jgi:hypothetical protein
MNRDSLWIFQIGYQFQNQGLFGGNAENISQNKCI